MTGEFRLVRRLRKREGCVFRFGIALSILALTLPAWAQSHPQRPKITGVSHLAVYASDFAASDRFYRLAIGLDRQPDPEDGRGAAYFFSPTQYVELLPLPKDAGPSRFDHIAFNTSSAGQMRAYLKSRHWAVPPRVASGADGSRWFFVRDPEGNRVQFVEPPSRPRSVNAPNAIGRHVIHLGMVVRDRAAEDGFYRDILGFRPYWYGGMKDDVVNFVSQQTPDSRDWLEYMLTKDLSSLNMTLDQRGYGVLDHLSVGVPSVNATFQSLTASGRLQGVHADAKPNLGRDGKMQLNLYDPDGTRVELMDFHAIARPCCSPFTAEDPSE